MDTARIAALTIPEAGQSMSGDALRDIRKPGVYVLMLKDKPQYVGVGKLVMGRLTGSNHKQADRAIALADKVLIYPCVSEEAAIELETILIKGLQPVWNKSKKGLTKVRVPFAVRRAKIRAALDTMSDRYLPTGHQDEKAA